MSHIQDQNEAIGRMCAINAEHLARLVKIAEIFVDGADDEDAIWEAIEAGKKELAS